MKFFINLDIDFFAIALSGLLGLLGIKALFSGFVDEEDDDDDDGSGEGSPVDLYPTFLATPA